MVSLKLLAIMTLIPGLHLVNISKIFAIVMLYGAGTDYCLFLISRYREELDTGFACRRRRAERRRRRRTALAASAGTVMCGLGLMALAEFAKVRYGGPAIALSLGVALLASLTLTPALLSLLGRKSFSGPASLPRRSQPPRGSPIFERCGRRWLWDMISRWVVKRPMVTWFAVAVTVLAPFVFSACTCSRTIARAGEN